MIKVVVLYWESIKFQKKYALFFLNDYYNEKKKEDEAKLCKMTNIFFFLLLRLNIKYYLTTFYLCVRLCGAIISK